MWFELASSARNARDDVARLDLSELVATRPRRQRAPRLPGERFPTGVRPGRRRAQGMDLDSIGPYVPGDDLRWMDWRATARTGRAQMKRFVAESHLARMLVVDLRPHMYFGTRDRPMAKSAALLAARICWEALSLHEPVGLLVIPHSEILRPRRGRAWALRMLQQLADDYTRRNNERHSAYASSRHTPRESLRTQQLDDSNAALGDALDSAARQLGHGDEVCLLSDFGGPLQALGNVARGIAGSRYLRAVVIEDAIHRAAPPRGRYPLRAAGDHVPRVATISSAAANDYARRTAHRQRELRRELMHAGWHVDEMADRGHVSAGAGP